MTKFNKLFALGFLLVSLVSCNKNSNSTSSSLKPASSTITQEMIDNLASGYKAEAIFSYSVSDITMSAQCIDVASTTNAYTYTSYEESLEPTRDVVTNKFRYEPNLVGNRPYVHQVELGFDNKIKKYPIADQDYNLILWDDSGFGNCFGHLSPFDFDKVEGKLNWFSLHVSAQLDDKITTGIANQFSGLIGLTLASFEVYMDGYNITEYNVTYSPLSSVYGTATYHSIGKFVEYGSDVIDKVKLVEGTIDEQFEEAIDSLRSYNYRLDYIMPDKTLKITCEGLGKLLYEEYDLKGKKTGCYGYYQDGNNVQGFTKFGTENYKDGAPFAGSVANALPTFNISSVFFNKSSESTDNKLIYTYREDVSKEVPQPSDYGMLNKQTVGTISITIEADAITITNQLSIGKEVYKYYDINKVTNTINTVHATCDNLTWSTLASNQPDDLTALYTKIPKEALDLIPTVGKTYSYIVLDVGRTTVFTIPVDDYTAGNELLTDYKAKLVDDGFILDETNTLTGELYIKEVQIDGKTCKLGARLYLAADFFVAPKVLVYPTYEIIE